MSHELQADQIGFAYEAGDDVLSGISLAVRSGALTGLVGPNGAGKSTLLRILCGQLKPRAGHVALDGRRLLDRTRLERARVLGFLPQTVAPAFSLDVFEVVCLGRYPHTGALGALGRHDFTIVERCMEDTEVTSLRRRNFMTLSGGERQRVLLASILAQEPKLLLLDEPTSALDIHHQIDIFSLLKRLVQTGYGIVVVTHDLNLAARFCDEVALLGRGSAGLVAVGPPVDVFTEERLSGAYDARIRVGLNPLTGTPLISAEAREVVS